MGTTSSCIKGEKISSGSFFNLAKFFWYNGRNTGIEPDYEKALTAIENEVTLYPANKLKYYKTYYEVLEIATNNKEKFASLVKEEIGPCLKLRVSLESDYDRLEFLYSKANLTEMSKSINEQKKVKFPTGDWLIAEEFERCYSETDESRKIQIAKNILKKAESDTRWNEYTDYSAKLIFQNYLKTEQWQAAREEFKKNPNRVIFADALAMCAGDLLEEKRLIDLAVEFAALATQAAKQELDSPVQQKPNSLTPSQWYRSRQWIYASYAIEYATALYHIGDYEKGYLIAKEIAIDIYEGKIKGFNGRYGLFLEKRLSPHGCKLILEDFMKRGVATARVKETLKRIYVKENRSEEGFDEYIAALEKYEFLLIVDSLRKSMIDKKASPFALKNLKGEVVTSESLEGKIVVLDFWATWCGPCLGSFPAMQKIVTKYKEDPNVQFLFVDVKEKSEDWFKQASNYVEKKKYTFNVLVDSENKLTNELSVNVIPTKIVIDKKGRIRFISNGFDGNDDRLMKEMDIMIALCENPSKTF